MTVSVTYDERDILGLPDNAERAPSVGYYAIPPLGPLDLSYMALFTVVAGSCT